MDFAVSQLVARSTRPAPRFRRPAAHVHL